MAHAFITAQWNTICSECKVPMIINYRQYQLQISDFIIEEVLCSQCSPHAPAPLMRTMISKRAS